MRLGLSSYTFPWAVGVPGHPPASPLGPLDLVRQTRGLGLGLLQLADNLPLHLLGAAELEALSAASTEQHVALEVGTRGIGPELSTYVELADRFGSSFVRLVVDQGEDRPSPSEAVARLRPFEARFRDRDVRLAIENHDRFHAAELVWMVEELGDWVGICLDTVNSLGALEPPEVVLDRLGPLTIALHLKDFTIRRPPHAMGFEVHGAPAGAGLLDVPWLLAELAAVAVVPTAVLELWTPPGPTVDATIARERAWAEQSIDHLRRHTTLQLD